MKKFLLTLIVALATFVNVSAQEFTWGTAKWSFEDGAVFEGIEDFPGLTLDYGNPSNYTLTYFNVVIVTYDVYIDGETTPSAAGRGSVQGGTNCVLSYNFSEGHSYKLVTTGAALTQANLATYTTDTLSRNDDVYTISFTIQGPELVKTINVEESMALTIVDQNWTPTFSVIKPKDICSVLGISEISEADIYGLRPDGSYVEKGWFADTFYGWRDADGGFTNWGGGYNKLDGHNAYPAVYSTQINATCDTIFYYFYDYWKVYDASAEETVPGSGLSTAKNRVPVTNYQNMIWDWENEDGTITKYTRRWRCEVGKDYWAGYIFKANKKIVKVNATLHFLSQEDYAEYIANKSQGVRGDVDGDGVVTISDITELISIYLEQ